MKNTCLPLLISFIIFISTAAQANSLDEVKETTQVTVNKVMQLLQDTKLAPKTKNQAIIQAVRDLFDFKHMAKLSLGKKYWQKMSKPQKEKFIDLFVKKLQLSYLDKLSLYTDEKVVIKAVEHPTYKSGKRKGKIKKTRILVNSALVKGGDEIAMVYKFYKNKKMKNWKVYDFDVEGVSLIQTYRSQFKGVLKKQTIAELLQTLAANNK